MAKLGEERVSVQNPLIKYACEIGWDYVSQEEALRLRGSETGLIFKDVFMSQIAKLNSKFIDKPMIEQLIKKIERLPANIEGNLQAWEYLKGIKTVYDPKEKRERNVCLIDKDIKRNVFQITDEFSYTNGIYRNRFDIVFLINGIPIFFVETKASHKIGGMEEALDQVRRYHRETPEPMTLLQIYTLTHLAQFYYASTWSYSMKTLFNWKVKGVSKNFENLVKKFFDKENVIKTILDYILFTRKDDLLQKVVLRPHQTRAIEKIIDRAADKKKNRGLVWHTQGSGKTYTMIVAAQKILENPMFENPTVIMLIDRNELESQLFGNLKEVGFENIYIAETKLHLRELLQSDTRGLIVTMIHKFEGMPKDINTRKNIFVLVDEAHRTTGGDLGNYLMGALPNATYIGFTGTPIDKTSYGKGTFIIFGKDDDPHGYLDRYGIAESIEDGTTVKIHYSLASNDLLPDKKTLEKEFLNLKEAAGVSDIDTLNKVLEKAVNLKNMLKNKERIKKVAKYVVEHYKNVVEPMGYKAFLVGVDREACALYKEELDKLLPKEYSEVVYSSAQNDPPNLAKYHLSEAKEKQVRKDFTKIDKLPKILIVTEKLLTGFDAPILYCMYLDKPMRDHVLLQAIARVNRPYEEGGIKKPCGLILDFVGIFDKLKKALAFDTGSLKDIEKVIKDLDILKDRFKKLIEKAKKNYLGLIKGKQGDKAVEAILTAFKNEEKRKEFYAFYNELSDIYEILSPDAFLRPYLEDYDAVSRMIKILKEAYEPNLLIDREFARKTAKLVQKYTKTARIRSSLEIYEINEKTLKKIEESTVSDIEKVFNLLKSIEKTVMEQFKEKPYLLSIGQRAEIISMMFKEGQKNTKEALEDLKEIVKSINFANKEQLKKKMPADVFSLYWILKENKIERAEKLANKMAQIFKEYPYWKVSEEQERRVKQELYKELTKVKTPIKQSVEVVKKTIDILKRAIK
ncbi:MAG: HsdR family type I site-specific deoxyribonuclease [Candidatus Pacearchaeota archaeon]|nr:HsdR family type I site-specific deoxyribonuclease [Candidatus Pacearchaeota archaeon]